jgi:hypothetical protein
MINHSVPGSRRFNFSFTNILKPRRPQSAGLFFGAWGEFSCNGILTTMHLIFAAISLAIVGGSFLFMCVWLLTQ